MDSQRSAQPTPTRLARVRSFVRRDGRLTAAQRTALEQLYPRFGIEVATTDLDLASVFPRPAPCHVDIGFGNGDTLLWQAERHPQINFLGIEVYPPGVGRALNGIESRGLTNVRVLQQDAVEVFAERLRLGSLAKVMLLFPDPWPKKRHHKRRIVQPAFLDLLAKALAPGGILHMATDWAPYAESMLEVADAHGEFHRITEIDRIATATERPSTHFERRGLRLGHDVADLAYHRI